MADLNKVIQYIMVLVIAGMFVGIGLTVLNSLGQSIATNTTTAETAINNTIASIATIPSTWLPILVIVAMAGIVIFLITKFGSNSQ